jgi:hypothetical protein
MTTETFSSEEDVEMASSQVELPRHEDELDLAATLLSMQSISTASPCQGIATSNSGTGTTKDNRYVAQPNTADLGDSHTVPTEETCCSVCGRHIPALATAPMDWSRPLRYPEDKTAIDAIIAHTTKYHKKAPLWNVLEAQHKLEFDKVGSGKEDLPITPVAYVKLALRHSVCSSYSIDDDLLHMGKLRDMFIRRLGIARGFIRWSADSFLAGRKYTNCGGHPVDSAELRQSALLLLAYLEEHVLEHAFEKNFHKTQELAHSMPFLGWRNAVQCVFLDPNGVENAWFMEEG